MPIPGLLRIGLPFKGFIARCQKHEAPTGYLTADSRDWAFAPKRGKWKRRAGSLIKGDTIAAGAEVTGILPAKWSAKSRQLFEMASDSLTDGNPTVAGLWSHEGNVWAQIAYRNTNGTDAWRTVGDEFATTYPLAGAFTPNGFRAIPLWSENALTFTRFANEKQRRMAFAGTRRGIQVGKWLYGPNAQGTPCRWNQRFDEGSLSLTAASHVWPTGHMPPLTVPLITCPAATAVGDESWAFEDRFLIAMAYRFEDGSIGRPFIPRPLTAVPLVAGLAVPQNKAGWIQSLAGAAGNKYHYIDWTQFPPGPPGSVSTILMRTPKVGIAGIPSIYAQVNGVTMLQLGIVAEIKNQTTQTYRDYNGNDASLFVDSVNIRFEDHKWPRRARSYFTFDGHLAAGGKLKANPSAIIISSRVVSGGVIYSYASMDPAVVSWVAVRDEQTRVAGSQVKVLLCGDDATIPTTGIVLATGGSTLQQVCDKISSSLAADLVFTHFDWVAQLVPGVDANVEAVNLEYTQVAANFITDTTKTYIAIGLDSAGGAGSIANVKVGMRIEAVSGVPANVEVGSLNVGGVGRVGLVDSTTGAAVNCNANHAGPTGVPIRIGWDFGDGVAGAYIPGQIRVFSNGYGAVLPFTKAYLDTLPTDDQAVDFTGADPGHARYAANSWYALNTRSVPATAGRFMGGGEVKNGAIVYYSRGKAAMTNVRAGKTGIDSDWTLQFVSGTRGAISPNVVQGNGWVAALTNDGIEVSDHESSRIISGDLYDPGEATGELAYEIAQCRIAAITGTDGGYFNMQVSGGRLRISYRSSSAFPTYPDRYMVYDFSPSEGLYGVAEVVRQDGSPYGWSCPHRVRLGAMCEVQDAAGTHLYGTIDANAGTGDGRVDAFETGTTDNEVAIAPIGYHSMLIDEDEFQRFWVKEVRAKYKKNGTGFRIGLSADKKRTGGNVYAFAMPTSGTDEFFLKNMPATQQMATSKGALEFWFDDDGTGTAPEIEGLIVPVEKLANIADGEV